jgi:transcription initiation factor TFIID TATA-box-binding protein
MLKDEPLVKIQNVVATGTLTHGIDLNSLVNAFPGVEYRPEQFPGVVFRLKKPKTATLIFSSGKMVCTGAKSERMARKALRTVVERMKRSGMIILNKLKIEIVNIVSTSNLESGVDLIGFYKSQRSMGGQIIYEPEQFPGLIYRVKNPRAVILLFSSGKMVCTGTKNKKAAHQAVEKLQQRLENHKMLLPETFDWMRT